MSASGGERRGRGMVMMAWELKMDHRRQTGDMRGSDELDDHVGP